MDTPAKRTAIGYIRTSSQTNVGADKDSHLRQYKAIEACAVAQGLQLAAVFFDQAVSGADPIDTRPGFRDMIALMLGNCARTIIVENATRFARDLMVQEVGYRMLKDQGIELIAADSPDSFVSDTPTATLIRQILGAVAQFEKAMLVEKLRGARDRASTKAGRRVEGARWMRSQPKPSQAAVEAARKAQARGLGLRAIARELSAAGLRNAAGNEFGPESVKRMLG